MDLVREILLQVEAGDDGTPRPFALKIEQHDESAVCYHIMILDEAGLIEARNSSAHGRIDWRPVRLTWEGHGFLDAARSDTLWNKAKQMAAERLGILSLEAVKIALAQLVAQSMK